MLADFVVLCFREDRPAFSRRPALKPRTLSRRYQRRGKEAEAREKNRRTIEGFPENCNTSQQQIRSTQRRLPRKKKHKGFQVITEHVCTRWKPSSTAWLMTHRENWNLLKGAKLEGRGSAALEYRKSADEEENKKETAPRTLKTKKLRSRPKRKTGYSRMARPCMIQRT